MKIKGKLTPEEIKIVEAEWEKNIPSQYYFSRQIEQAWKFIMLNNRKRLQFYVFIRKLLVF